MKKIIAKVLILCMIVTVLPVGSVRAAGNKGEAVYSETPEVINASEVAGVQSDREIVDLVKEELTIINQGDIRENITLPVDNTYNAQVQWTSSDEEVISTKETTGLDYDKTPGGVVNRGNEDKEVTLTAQIQYGTVTDQKIFDVVVKAKSNITEADYEAYLFAYFTGEGRGDGEQIYFATSKDGLNWDGTNDGKPVLTSSLGEKGLRDPFIIRSPEGDKFYLIATDLKINGKPGNAWGDAQTKGSTSIMIWESTDLVNWSEQRMAKVALDTAGCTWAPEAFYDQKTGEYIVFWASKTSADNYNKQRIYYCKTRDFYTFTEPEVWIELRSQVDNQVLSVIDTSVISVTEEDGSLTYYRLSKNEDGTPEDGITSGGKYTILETSKSLLGNWTRINSETLRKNQWVEGGTSFKFNGEEKWCVLLDDNGGIGYYPLVTTDFGSGDFTRLSSTQYSFPSTLRHGTVLPITMEEYKDFNKKYNAEIDENTDPEAIDPILSYDFNEDPEANLMKDTSGNGRDGEKYGNASYITDPEMGQVLYLDGTANTYAELPQGFFDGRNNLTISMDIKADTVSGDYFTFGIGADSNRYLFLKTQNTQTKLAITRNSYTAEQVAAGTTKPIAGKWMNITMVVTREGLKLYKDKELIGKNDKITIPVTGLQGNLKSYLGKSFFENDGYFKGCFDNLKVYNRALSEEEIKDEKVTVIYEASEGGRIAGAAVQTFSKGGDAEEVAAIAENGYSFLKWSDGVTTASRTDRNVTQDRTLTAEFLKEVPKPVEKVTVTYQAGEGGTIRGTLVQTIDKGSNTTEVTAAADSGYRFDKWSDGVMTPSRADKSVTASKSVTALFTKTAVSPKPDTPEPVKSKVKINKSRITLGIKESVSLTASVTPAAASKKVTWSSSKKSNVTVSSKGKITGKKAGTATITVKTSDGASAKCNVTVKKAPSKITLNAGKKTLKRGKTFTIKTKLSANSASYKMTYSTSNKKVAVVSSSGKITAKKKGNAVITVKTFNGKKAAIKILVK